MDRIHGYYYDGKTQWVMYEDEDGYIEMREMEDDDERETEDGSEEKVEAEIEDAKYKIECYSQQELLIPDHADITGEVDKLLHQIGHAEEKMAVLELHYGKNKAKEIL